ncbi:MAG: phage tail protein, partial [Planctomycetes bacterium]|nr:phage tail protein [Planctomycetota bacterium]
MSEPFIAEIKMIAFSYAPRNYAMCDGQLLEISQNPTLFALIDNTFGGNGTSTMGVPDLRGRMAIHAGQGPGLSNYRQGQYGGMEQVQLQESQMPTHKHPATPSLTSTTPATTATATDDSPSTDNTSVLGGDIGFQSGKV